MSLLDFPRGGSFILLSGILLLFVGAFPATATVIHVPADQPTIQQALDVALTGDRIEVSPGIYYQCIDTLGKAVTLVSVSGPQDTVIDGTGCSSVVNCTSGEGSETIIEGFTITGGDGGNYGGGVNIVSASPTIRGNLITGNIAAFGAGLSAEDSSAVIEGNQIVANTCDGAGGGGPGPGGGIYLWYAPCVISNNEIRDNTASAGGGIYLGLGNGGALVCGNIIKNNIATEFHGGAISSLCRVMISDNLIVGNEAYEDGGGIFLEDEETGTTVIANNLILNNSCGGEGGGVAVLWYTSCSVSNCTIIGNSAGVGGGVYRGIGGTSSNCILTGNIPDQVSGGGLIYSCVEGGWLGTGNINADPLFVSGPLGDYYLSSTASGHPLDSPCIDGGMDLASATCRQTLSGLSCLDVLTTDIYDQPDSGQVDMGYHYPIGLPEPTISASLSCQPASGTLPFTTSIWVTLGNTASEGPRRAAARIDVVLASGASYGSWRAGWTNITSGSVISAWNQLLPNLSTLAGVNEFTLIAEDVTPAPYNQPPYAASGSTASHGCTVTGDTP